MKTKFCRVTTKDNLRLAGLLFEPDKKSNKVILHIHGMASNFYDSVFLDVMAKTYTNYGFAFLTGNNRGHDYIANFQVAGKKEKYKKIGAVFEKIEDCVLDIDAWLKFLKQDGYKVLILHGHSLGTVKAVYYLNKRQNHPFNALVLASPSDMLGLVRLKREKNNFARDMKEAKELTKLGKGDFWLKNRTWGLFYKSAAGYVNFFADKAKTDVFPVLRGGKFKELESIKIPIFAFYGDAERGGVIFSPQKDLEIIGSHFKNGKSKTLLIKESQHRYFGCEERVAKNVVNWLNYIL